jgi:hypothetical protein
MPRLADLAEQYGSDKDAHYLDAYEDYFHARRSEPVRILELGVRTGSSLEMWADYFPNARIVGIDLSPRPDAVRASVGFVQGSQDDPATLERARQFVGGQWDVIIDDCSHLGAETKQSFKLLFPHLVPGGLYVIEDCGASFIPDFRDQGPYPSAPDDKRFRSYDYGILGVVKQLIDDMFLNFSQFPGAHHKISRMDIYPHIAFVKKI